MPDTIKVDKARGIIEIRSYGVLTKEDMKASIEKVLEIKKERGIFKALIDTTEIESVPDTFEIYETMSSFPPGLRVALIVGQHQPTARDIHFGEIVARNRGKNMRVFSKRSSAIEWLEGLKGASP